MGVADGNFVGNIVGNVVGDLVTRAGCFFGHPVEQKVFTPVSGFALPAESINENHDFTANKFAPDCQLV